MVHLALNAREQGPPEPKTKARTDEEAANPRRHVLAAAEAGTARTNGAEERNLCHLQ
jgi:hypothetical protein